MKTTYKLSSSLIALALVSGCVTTAPERAYEVRQPKSAVVRTFTSFSESLRCMDELFLQYGVQGIVITSDGIPDATGEVSAGTKDMLISAISRMSVHSGAFTFVDYDQRQEDVANLQQLVGFTDDFRIPSYYIRGAITQLDQGVIAESVGGSIAFPNVSIGASKDQVVSVISTDMNVGRLATRQIIPGISANNSIVVRRSGFGADAGATIEKVGLSFNISINNQEGMHQATRTLIELSAIEITGKLTKVPYWRCLQIEQTNPQINAQARGWFKKMSEKERVVFTQRALSASGEYRGPINGTLDPATKAAIGRYQASHGLIASTRIDYDLYESLNGANLAVGKRPAPVAELPKQAPAPIPLQIRVTTPRGSNPTYHVRESLSFTVTTSRDAYIACYYEDANETITRIFPNKFVPDSRVAANNPTVIPGKDGRFGIVFDQPDVSEEVLCLAAEHDASSHLPDALKQKDLTPLSVDSLDDIVDAYREAAPARVTDAWLPIEIAK